MNHSSEKKSKKVLLITLEYPPFKGGVANYYGNVVKHWPDGTMIDVLDNSHQKLINEKMLFFKWRRGVKVVRALKKKALVDHLLVGQILPLGAIAWLSGIPYTVVIHGMDLEFAKKISRKRWLAKKILLGADSIICNSNYVKGLVEDFIGKNDKKIFAVNPGVERPAAADKKTINSLIKKFDLGERKILLSIGRLVKRKGVDKVIEAMPRIVKSCYNVLYVVVGAGHDEKYLRDKLEITIMDSHGIRDNVVFAGQVSDDERQAWLTLCDIFIMPARNINGDVEGLGIVYLEAAACGKPVIAGNAGGVSDAVKNGFNGLIVDAESSASIAEGVVDLLNNPDKKAIFGENGKRMVIKDFDWTEKAGQIYRIINN